MRLPIRKTSMVVALSAIVAVQAHAASVPPPLRVPPHAQLVLAAHARGVQIYDCKAGSDGAMHWTFRAPEAALVDADGKALGSHYAGPTWESTDGSKVVARVSAQAEAPDASAIPWLLLTTTSSSGPGVLNAVTHVQRVATAGGRAPAGTCDAAQPEARVPYTATYLFFAAPESTASARRPPA